MENHPSRPREHCCTVALPKYPSNKALSSSTFQPEAIDKRRCHSSLLGGDRAHLSVQGKTLWQGFFDQRPPVLQEAPEGRHSRAWADHDQGLAQVPGGLEVNGPDEDAVWK